MQPKELAFAAAKALNSKKGRDIRVLHIEDLTVVTDYIVIAAGTSGTQVKALAEEVEFKLEQEGVKTLRAEGYQAKNWILLDYGSVIVHVFSPEAREYYDLERLWADGIPEELPLAQWDEESAAK